MLYKYFHHQISTFWLIFFYVSGLGILNLGVVHFRIVDIVTMQMSVIRFLPVSPDFCGLFLKICTQHVPRISHDATLSGPYVFVMTAFC